MSLFFDRTDAGQELAKALAAYWKQENAIVLALPRGGVPVAYEIAKALCLPLDVFLVRKLGSPWNKEFAIGAIAEGDICILNENAIQTAAFTTSQLNPIIENEKKELIRREKKYRKGKPLLQLQGKTVILVDDGLATGATMHAAVLSIRKHIPEKIIIAVPVGAEETVQALKKEADELICLQMPSPFYGVGQWYENFPQTSDEEVITLLEAGGKHAERRHRV